MAGDYAGAWDDRADLMVLNRLLAGGGYCYAQAGVGDDEAAAARGVRRLRRPRLMSGQFAITLPSRVISSHDV